jgi:hypothetical protein
MKKFLKDVTLIAYSSNDVKENIESLQKCMEYFDFGAVKIISHKKPDYLPEGIVYERGREIKEINDFNEYMFLFFGVHVNTSHCLYVQHHSWILNHELWKDEWLQYDLAGAVWPIVPNSYLTDDGERVRVGNDGFALKSRRLLLAPSILGLKLEQRQSFFNVDGNTSIYHRSAMLKYGIKYMPVEEAAVFSYENPVPENNYGNMKTFGFHRNRRENE